MSPEVQNTSASGGSFGFGVEGQYLLEIYIWELILVGSAVTLLFLLYRRSFISKTRFSVKSYTPKSIRKIELDTTVPESPESSNEKEQIKQDRSLMDDFGGSGDNMNSMNFLETSLSTTPLTIVKTCDLGEDIGRYKLPTERGDDLESRILSLEGRFESNEKALENTLEEIKFTKDGLVNVQQKLNNLKNKIEKDRNQIKTSINKAVHAAIKSLRSSSKSYKASSGKGAVIEGKETAVKSELQSLGDKIRMLKMQADSLIPNENFGLSRNSSLVDLRPLSRPSYVSTIKARSPQLLSSRVMRATPSQNSPD